MWLFNKYLGVKLWSFAYSRGQNPIPGSDGTLFKEGWCLLWIKIKKNALSEWLTVAGVMKEMGETDFVSCSTYIRDYWFVRRLDVGTHLFPSTFPWPQRLLKLLCFKSLVEPTPWTSAEHYTVTVLSSVESALPKLYKCWHLKFSISFYSFTW